MSGMRCRFAPNGNDLSEMLNSSVKDGLSVVAYSTLKALENDGWENVFGKIEKISDVEKIKSLHQITSSVSIPTKPWYKQ